VETIVGVVQLVQTGVAGCSNAVTRLAAPDYWQVTVLMGFACGAQNMWIGNR
jgi:hypothetical protein